MTLRAGWAGAEMRNLCSNFCHENGCSRECMARAQADAVRRHTMAQICGGNPYRAGRREQLRRESSSTQDTGSQAKLYTHAWQTVYGFMCHLELVTVSGTCWAQTQPTRPRPCCVSSYTVAEGPPTCPSNAVKPYTLQPACTHTT